MTTLFSILLGAATLAVFISLVLGLSGMVQKKPSDAKQNRLMQARVGFQFLALVLLGVLFALKGL